MNSSLKFHIKKFLLLGMIKNDEILRKLQKIKKQIIVLLHTFRVKTSH